MVSDNLILNLDLARPQQNYFLVEKALAKGYFYVIGHLGEHMNIRKHWKKVLLSSTAFFWASCGGDSESASVTSGANNETPPDSITTPDDLDGTKIDTLYGIRPVYDIDSGAVSSSDACESSSSSEEVQSSSSEAESSSSYDPSMPYRLASDPSIHCAWENFVGATFECLDGQDYQATVRWKKEQLANNQTRTLEQLDSLEDKTKAVLDEYDVPLYGVPSNTCTHRDLGTAVYKCSDGQTYPANFYVDGDKILYTEEEYRAKYPEKFQSSSSSEPEPESSSSVPPPSPLCQKNDFATYSEMQEVFEKDMNDLLDSTKNAAGNNLSESDSNCLANVHISRSYADVDVLAKKQICDGDTTVNPRYLERIDTHKEYIRKQIKRCLDEEN